MTFDRPINSSPREGALAGTLDRDGFVVLRGFLEADELSKVEQLVEPILRTPCEQACKRPHNELFPLRWDSPLVQLFLGSDRRVRLLAEMCDADDLRWISGYLSIKNAHSPALWWHQDWWCWDHAASYQRTPAQLAVLCYLTATTVQNGALRVLPGTHHRSALIHAILPEAHGEFVESLDTRHAALSDQPGQVTLSLRAGDAVVMDYRLIHGTHANESDTRRDCIILNFAPSWRRLPDDIKGHLICHTALPLESETVPDSTGVSKLLPTFSGERRSLPLSRNAPARFEVAI
jgi:hypothetical protein